MRRIITLICLLGFFALPAEAYDYYGAIAYSPSTDRWGTSNECGSADDAMAAAVAECGVSDCQAKFWFSNQCGALAKSSKGDLGWGSSVDRGDAENTALAKCGEYGNPCNVLCWSCTTRPSNDYVTTDNYESYNNSSYYSQNSNNYNSNRQGFVGQHQHHQQHQNHGFHPNPPQHNNPGHHNPGNRRHHPK